MNELVSQLRRQSGVISRRDVLALGYADSDLRRWTRRRDLVRVLPGIYLDHTGVPHWRQRAWIAVLALEPAALCRHSALRAVNGPGRSGDDHGPIAVAVDRGRSPRAPAGVALHHFSRFTDRVLLHTSPPRQRTEDAVLDLAADASTDLDAIGRLADAVQARLTTAARLRGTLDTRLRTARRHFLTAVLADVEAGTGSVLEQRYLADVERAHGLPRPLRQARGALRDGTSYFTDVDYRRYGLRIELDGRLFHDSARQRDLDLERDLVAATVDGGRTVRLGWGQVAARPCTTAAGVATLLRRGGWRGSLRPCPRCSVPYAAVVS